MTITRTYTIDGSTGRPSVSASGEYGPDASSVGAQPLDSDLTAIAALATSAFGRGLLDDADAAAALISLGAQAADSDLAAIAALTTTPYGRGLLELANIAAFRAEGGTYSGTGDPEGVVTATPGKEYFATDLGRRFVKMTGSGNTGWSSYSDAYGTITLPTGVFLYVPHNTVSTTIFAANGDAWYTPVYIPHACTISEVGIEVSTIGTAGGTCLARIGLYAMGSDLEPGALISDMGTVDTGVGTIKTITGLTVAVPRGGWYYFVVAQQGAPVTRATIRTVTNIGETPYVTTGSGTAAANTGARNMYSSASITGALAANPTVTPFAGPCAKVQFKLVSVP